MGSARAVKPVTRRALDTTDELGTVIQPESRAARDAEAVYDGRMDEHPAKDVAVRSLEIE